MTDREKLIKLLSGDMCKDVCCYDCEYEGSDSACIEHIKQNMADHLLANGVTFQKWTSVTERLPEHGQEVIVYSGNVLKPTVFAYQFWNPKYDSWKHITHWMPLPEPPKEV